MLFAVPAEPYEIDPVAAEAIDLLFILQADHEQNCSTSTVRMAGSSGANPYSAIAAGISALWGPAHGGANEAVLKMLTEIGDKSQISKYVAKAKDKNDPFRLMGFGHRVYKNFDPRATIIRGMCHKVLKKLGRERRFLFRHHLPRAGYPDVDVHGHVRDRAVRRLDSALARNDHRPQRPNCPAAAALHGADETRLRADFRSLIPGIDPRSGCWHPECFCLQQRGDGLPVRPLHRAPVDG
jgi:hypothetical protein